jgi:phosphonate transport system substrate-binding protein
MHLREVFLYNNSMCECLFNFRRTSAMQKVLSAFSAGAAALFLFFPVFAERAYAEIKFGILPRLSAVEMYVMFNPLARYLSQETGEKISIVIPKDFDSFKTAVKAGELDMGFCNSIVYVELRKEVQIEPLALSAEQKGGTRFRGIILARKDSGIKTVQDLKGKRLVFVDRGSAGGYVFQMMLLKNAGMDIHKDFVLLPFAKKHDNVIMAVFNRVADAGGIREDDLEKMKGKVDLSQIRIIAYTEYFPNWPLFAAPSLNKDLTAKVKAALLKLKPKKPQTTTILGPAKLAGFAPVSDRDYDRLRQAAKLAGLL